MIIVVGRSLLLLLLLLAAEEEEAVEEAEGGGGDVDPGATDEPGRRMQGTNLIGNLYKQDFSLFDQILVHCEDTSRPEWVVDDQVKGTSRIQQKRLYSNFPIFQALEDSL